jgi:hypothetical protein
MAITIAPIAIVSAYRYRFIFASISGEIEPQP